MRSWQLPMSGPVGLIIWLRHSLAFGQINIAERTHQHFFLSQYFADEIKVGRRIPVDVGAYEIPVVFEAPSFGVSATPTAPDREEHMLPGRIFQNYLVRQFTVDTRLTKL